MRNIFLVLLVLGLGAIICSCSADNLTVEDIWARPGNTGGNGAVYFVINNPTDQDDILLIADGDIAEHVELHLSKMKDDGSMTMIQQESVPVPAGGSVEFKPGGLHVMLINLKRDLKPGDTFDLSLNFENAGEMNVAVTVQEP